MLKSTSSSSKKPSIAESGGKSPSKPTPFLIQQKSDSSQTKSKKPNAPKLPSSKKKKT